MENERTQVTIAGKTYNLSGYDSEYLQKVAAYLNSKHDECMEKESFKRISFDLQSLFLQLNIADDYFSALDEIESLKEIIAQKENEIYDIKHELVTSQMKQSESTKNASNASASKHS